MKSLSFKGFDIKPEEDYLKSRKTLFVNNDLHIGLAAPKKFPKEYFFKNADADELLYYVDGDFMSRNNIEKGQIILHPGGIPHGPHPGTIERSIGQKETGELAVMIDPSTMLRVTFRL